jgi:uncharacterized membrane protein YbhN (UPF0104 family)
MESKSVSLTSTLPRKILLIGRIVATALIAAYIYHRMDWGSLYGALRLTNPAKLVAAVCLQGCTIALAATRWQALLANQGIQLGWPQTARLVLMGLFFNLFYLGSVGGDAAKFVATLPHAPEGKASLALSLVQDRVIGLGALLLLLTGFIAWHFPLLRADRAAQVLAIGVPAACAAYFAVAATWWGLTDSPGTENPTRTSPKRSFIAEALRESFPKAVFLPALILSLLIHGLVIMAGYLAAHAMGIAISFSEAGVVLGVTALVLSLPITIAGLGVRDGMLIWLLAAFGFKSTSAAVGLSSCLLGIALFWALAGCAAFYWPSAPKKAPQ